MPFQTYITENQNYLEVLFPLFSTQRGVRVNVLIFGTLKVVHCFTLYKEGDLLEKRFICSQMVNNYQLFTFTGHN
jgi:hypothetical protein